MANSSMLKAIFVLYAAAMVFTLIAATTSARSVILHARPAVALLIIAPAVTLPRIATLMLQLSSV